MIETQSSINEWAEVTFGPMTSVRHMVARANQEMAELLSAVTMPVPNILHIPEECADVAIVLLRVAGWTGEDLTPIFTLDNLLVGEGIYGPAVRANASLSFLLERLDNKNLIQKQDIAQICGRIILRLAGICSAIGTTLADQIDAKMVILRTRKWNLDGTGCGYHVKVGLTPWKNPNE